MTSTNRRSIFLKSISCKGIRSPIPLTAPSLYATVSLSTTDQQHRTSVDAAHGEDHDWDCPMRFYLPTDAPHHDHDLFLDFHLKAQVPVLGDRLVGTAHVPISDLMDNGSSGHAGYQVLWPDGKPNGTIQLWYQVEGSELPAPGYSYLSPQPSAPPSAESLLYYKPSVEQGPVYPASVPVGNGTVPFSSQLVNSISGPVVYPPPPPPPQTTGSLYPPPPPPDSGFASLVPSYPPPAYYPPPGTHYPPVDCGECGPAYYPPPPPPPPPSMGSDCCDRECREPQQPVMAYPAGTHGYYPPPPRYPYY